MKKISLLITIVALITSGLISCKNNADSPKNAEVSAQQHDGQGHPPKDKDDKKRPPRGERPLPVQTKTLEEIGGYKMGEVATDFELKNVDDSTFSLSDIKDAKGYIVVFTCNGCPFAKMYEDRLVELHNEYAPQGYSVVAINPNVSPSNDRESLEAMQERAKEKAFPFVYLADEGQTIAPQYGAVRTPHVFILDNERKVQYIGTIDDNADDASEVTERYVENAIDALQRGEKPTPDFTKAIGCPVKKV